MTFQVGDRVEALCDHPQRNDYIRSGWTGTIVKVDNVYPPIGVRWDAGSPEYGWGTGDGRLHDCHGECEDGYGWFVSIEEIRIIEELVAEDFEVNNDDIFAMIGGRV